MSAPRSAGVLFHPTSLPGTPACGTFGEQARSWIALLAQAGVGVWQVLPLAPTDSLPTNFPYTGITRDPEDLTKRKDLAGWSVDRKRVKVGKGQDAYKKIGRAHV